MHLAKCYDYSVTINLLGRIVHGARFSCINVSSININAITFTGKPASEI